jgi:inorganic pyrophosphatase
MQHAPQTIGRPGSIPPREGQTGLVHVVIDTPRGSGNKYKYDEALSVFRISRMLPAGMHFPYDFGSVPGTLAEDGDPLDVLVLLDSASFAGCLITVRLIGGLRVKQRERAGWIQNDRLIATPETPVNPAQTRSLRSLTPVRIGEIEHFFQSYNQAQGRELRIASRFGAGKANKILSDSIRAYRKGRGPR